MNPRGTASCTPAEVDGVARTVPRGTPAALAAPAGVLDVDVHERPQPKGSAVIDPRSNHYISATTSAGQLLHQVRFQNTPSLQNTDLVRLLGNASPDVLPGLVASCRCGWTHPAAAETGQTIAIDHCLRDSALPVYQHGAHTAIGSRQANADSFASAVDDHSGIAAFAVSGGIGDTQDSAVVAAMAAHHAVRVATQDADATAGVLAANAAVLSHGDHDGDAVLVVAVARTTDIRNEIRWNVAWVGDCRAYLLEQDELRQLTTDQTVGQQLRGEGVSEETAAPYDHQVHTTVGSADIPGSIDTTSLTTRAGRLALVSDGIAKSVPHKVIGDVLTAVSDPDVCARTLTLLGTETPNADNATALVVDLVPVA